MLTHSKRLSPQGKRGRHDKSQVIEEPCEGKLSSTVLKARQGGDSLSLASGQRLDWRRRTRCQIDRCSIVSEPIGEIPTTVNYYTQQSDLKQTKVLFPDYKNI